MQRTSYVSPIAYDEGPMYGNAGTTYIPITQNAQKYALLLSENFSFLIVSLIYFAMFKIKSSRYQDLILNSTGCRGSNRLSRQPQVLDTHLHASTLFAVRSSQFAVRSSQFAVRNSQHNFFRHNDFPISNGVPCGQSASGRFVYAHTLP